jgi:UDP-N-acetylglucosamine transferase subunit ALG13
LFAHHRIAQSAGLRAFWPDAPVFDPLRILSAPSAPKRSLLFVTVGATLPFDRLVNCVARLKETGEIEEAVVIQTGVGGVKPPGMEVYESLPFERTIEIAKEASIVVCHGGTGSLITALREGAHVIAMPRLFERGEHYDNHQTEITAAFAARGLISVANNAEEMADAIRRARTRPAVSATSEPTALIGYLAELLTAWPKRPAPAKPSQ